MATSSQISSSDSRRWSTEVNKVRLTLLIALMFTTLGAGVFRTPSLMLMTALLMGAPFVGILVSRLASRSLAVNRHLPTSGTIGDTIGGDITVHNHSRWPRFMVHLRSGEVVYQDENGEQVEAVVPVHNDDLVAPVVRARDSTTWRHQWHLQRRGIFKISPARAGVLDPIGLYTRLPNKTGMHQITVLPRPVQVNQLSFLGGIATGKQMPQHATAVADATDFHGVRPWRPGEGLRRVHWKNTARTGQLHVVEWEEALASDTTVLLDTQAASIAGSGADSTLEVAITLAASVAAYLLQNGYQFELLHWEQPVAPTHQARLRLLPMQRGTGATANPAAKLHHFRARNAGHVGAALHALAAIQPVLAAEATLPLLCEQAAPQLAAGRSILVIASSLANTKDALHRLESLLPAGASCQALVLDAESFAANVPVPVSLSRPSERAASASRRIRLVRRGESLATVLERQW